MTDEPVTVGVLSLHTSKETKAILNAVDELDHRPVWLRQENTVVNIQDGQVTLEPDVDVVANRLLLTNTEQPAEGLGLASIFAALRPMLNQPPATMTAVHKFATATVLAEAGLPVPDALLALSASTLNADRTSFGPEAVYKTAIGTHGGGTWKVSTADNLNPTIGNRRAFLQELIDVPDQTHRDLRVYVVGDRVVGAMYRYAPEGDWRTNVALGGAVEDATDDLTDEVRELSVEAARIIGLDYAGVDLVETPDGHAVLEVNPTAGFKGLFQATGRSAAPHIAGHRARRRHGRSGPRPGAHGHAR